MNRSESDEMCPLIANQWPTRTDCDGRVTLRSQVDPADCRGQYYLPPASSRPQRDADDETWPTSHDCPLDNPRRCPHWAQRMDRYGERFGIPPRSRNASVEDLPGDIADDAIGYLRSVVSRVDDGANVIIAGPVGAGKTCTAGLILITYARLAGTDLVRLIGAEMLFQFLATLCPGPDWARGERWDGLVATPLLVIDDLGTELATSAAVRGWHRLIDERYQAGRATIITTNVAELDEIFHDGRTRSRFMAKCEVWRTGRGDIRGVAATPISEPGGGGAVDAGANAAETEVLAACLPRPRTREEWEAVGRKIRSRSLNDSADIGYLLADYGVPAVATFIAPDPDILRLESVLRETLTHLADNRSASNLLDTIAWRSHAFGLEYPAHFLLRDWRERLADVPWSDGARSRYGIPSPGPQPPGSAGDG